MKLTVLGSGTARTNIERHSTSLMVETEDITILFDVGGQSSRRLAEKEFDLAKVDIITVSHPHADHIGDLLPLIHSMFLGHIHEHYKDGFGKRTKPLYIRGYPGFKEHYEKLRDIMFPERVEPYEVNVKDLEDETEEILGLKLTGVVVPHTPYWKSNGYRLESNSKVFAFSGDISGDKDYLTPLGKLCQSADLAAIEAGNPPSEWNPEHPNGYHTSAWQAGEAAAKAGAKRLLLTHLYDYDPPEASINLAKENFSGEIIVAKDNLEIKI